MLQYRLKLTGNCSEKRRRNPQWPEWRDGTFGLRRGFSASASLTCLGHMILCYRGCPVHCTMFSSLYPLIFSGIPLPSHDNQNVSRYRQMSPRRQNCSVENLWFKEHPEILPREVRTKWALKNVKFRAAVHSH